MRNQWVFLVTCVEILSQSHDKSDQLEVRGIVDEIKLSHLGYAESPKILENPPKMHRASQAIQNPTVAVCGFQTSLG
jgi:hypothetical protein